jgi:esterase/lipase superfamily enzyme
MTNLLTAALKDVKVPVSMIAHSHGCDIAIKAIKAIEPSCERRLAQFIAVEPDVDLKYAKQQMEKVSARCEHVTVYHNATDLALEAAGWISGDEKLGRTGIDASSKASGDVWEVIDTTEVNQSTLRHAPQIESPEVMADIHRVLRGERAADRFNVHPLNSRPGRWRLGPNLSFAY